MTEEKQSARRGSFWRELPILLGVAILVAVIVRAFLVQTFWIPSASMENTLDIDDRVLVNKLVYTSGFAAAAERSSSSEAPESWRGRRRDEDFIKRVIGVGGDHMVCCDEQGRLIVNGRTVGRAVPFLLGTGSPTRQPPVVRGHCAGWAVVGDGGSPHFLRRLRGTVPAHRRRCQASTISEDAVIGRAFLLFWPLSRATWLSVPETLEPVPEPPAVPADPSPSGPG